MQYLLEMSICTVIFYGLFVMLYEDKNNHQFNRFYLLVSLLFSIGIPLLEIPVFPQYVLPVFSENVIDTGVSAGEEGFNLNWRNGLFTLWIVGVLFNMFLVLKSVFSLFRIIKNSEKRVEEDHTKVFTNGKMAVSSFLHYLFVPKEQEHSISDYEIKHELTHIRQRHSFDVLFVESIKAIFWFNPLMYLYQKRLAEIHEFLADQNTSNKLGKEAYEAFLIRQITARQQPRLVHNFYSLFKKRLVMMQSNNNVKNWQYWAVLPIFSLCFLLFSCENYIVNSTDKVVHPVIQSTLEGEIIDTIITFHPDTYEETIEYVKSKDKNRTTEGTSVEYTSPGIGIDTIIIFDPEEYSETVIIVNHETGLTDTIQ